MPYSIRNRDIADIEAELNSEFLDENRIDRDDILPPEREDKVMTNENIILYNPQEKLYLSIASSEYNANVAANEWYATLNTSQSHVFHHSENIPLTSDIYVKIRTNFTKVEGYPFLGAWSTPCLYYYKGGNYDQLEWKIQSKNGQSSSQIYYGDSVVIVNKHYNEYMSLGKFSSNVRYLTTSSEESQWIILPSE